MMLVIGLDECSKCQQALNYLDKKNIKYRYENYDDLNKVEKDYYFELARKAGHAQFPIVINDYGDVVPKYVYMRK